MASMPLIEDVASVDAGVDYVAQEDRAIRLCVVGIISQEQLQRQLAMIREDRVQH